MDYRRMINLGRKAGLRTTELYSALAGRRPEIGDDLSNRNDCNGYVATYGPDGHRQFQPQAEILRK